MKIERILLSCDDNPDYIQFLPIVSLAWQKLLGIKPTLAYVPKEYTGWEGRPAWVDEYCDAVEVYSFLPEIKRGSTSTYCARMLSRLGNEDRLCMVSDIDLVPLSSKPFENLPQEFDETNFLSIGYNAFANGDGNLFDPAINNSNLRKFPSCYTIASGNVWEEIINPNELDGAELLKSWYSIHDYDPQEAIINTGYFCDESLMRALIQRWNPSRNRVIGIDRDFPIERLDRSDWNVNEAELKSGRYIDAHCPRPLKRYEESIRKITDYLGIPFIIGGENV